MKGRRNLSFSEEISRRRDGANAIFHKFRTSVRDDRHLHVFMEGYEDILYYERLLREIKGLFGVSWNTYNCLGKKNMDRVTQLLRESAYADHNVLFLRDSDFDKFLGVITPSEQLFLTCGYSVENYVCTEGSIAEFIRVAFGVDAQEVNSGAYAKGHSERVKRLFEWMAPTIGAALVAVRNGRQLDLNRIDVRAYYKLLLDGEGLPESIPAEVLAQAGIEEADFNGASLELGRAFVQQDAMRWLRGKYLIECTGLFLAHVREELAGMYRRREITRFRRAGADFAPAVLFERLCPFAHGTPELRGTLAKGLGVAA